MKEKPTLLIDNECPFCSKTMYYVSKRGGENKFNFLSLYSEEGRKILSENGFQENYNKSVVLVEDGEVYTKSDAALKVTRKLNGIFPVFYWFKIIPKTVRDSVYEFISRHRHKIV